MIRKKNLSTYNDGHQQNDGFNSADQSDSSPRASYLSSGLIIEKYGGATLADAHKIKLIAKDIASKIKRNEKRVIVVSAMGQTTNQLIDMARMISPHPIKREMDMLLSTGERVSMSLLSIALNDLGCSAISFTGSQAGVLTSDSHLNATVKNIKAHRVIESLNKNQVVILAGFQGVSPETKDVTTIGRGGSDLSAVAMTIFLQAQACHILKDVPSIFSADPRIVTHAQALPELSYEHLAEMTFWGAKVLHYRSAELALLNGTSLYIGPAASSSDRNKMGTTIEKYLNENSQFIKLKQKASPMFETHNVLAINAHESVLKLNFSSEDFSQALKSLTDFLNKNQIAFPQILHTQQHQSSLDIYITAPKEQLQLIETSFKEASPKNIKLNEETLSMVTATCTGLLSPEIWSKISTQLEKKNLHPKLTMTSALSLSFLCHQKDQQAFTMALHELVI